MLIAVPCAALIKLQFERYLQKMAKMRKAEGDEEDNNTEEPVIEDELTSSDNDEGSDD